MKLLKYFTHIACVNNGTDNGYVTGTVFYCYWIIKILVQSNGRNTPKVAARIVLSTNKNSETKTLQILSISQPIVY
jgi:hypothetical protein